MVKSRLYLKELMFGIAILILCLNFGSALEFNHVVTNSENWMDVYSGIHYANLLGVSSDFLTSEKHAGILLNSLSKSKNIRVVTSKTDPYAFNYPDLIRTKGFAGADEIISKNLNLELINDIPSISNFVIVDTSYGYNAIAVVPYAVQKKSWVFFADKSNIDEVDSILSKRNVDEVLIYGYVDREVRETLLKYSPKIINNQDKFEDNIEITKEYLIINPKKQVLLTNGEFIEKELMSGTQPILFTGRDNVPDQIRDYLKSSQIEIGVLIGNELMGAATNIRRSAGISVMVKFARGARAQNAGISAVEGLDLFPLPTPSLNLEVYSVEYNKMLKQLEVTYKSSANTPMYMKGTITVKENSGEQTKVGDSEQIFIAPGSYKTIIYSMDIVSLTDLKAQLFVIYGETKSSLERVLEGSWDVKTIEIIDSCEVDVKKVSYNKQKKEFQIKVENIADVNCWADASLEDLTVGYSEETVSTDKSYRIEAGKTAILIISQELLAEDIQKNDFVNLIVNYGEREDGLVKTITGRFELFISTFATFSYLAILLLFGIGIFLFLFLSRRKKEKASNFDF